MLLLHQVYNDKLVPTVNNQESWLDLTEHACKEEKLQSKAKSLKNTDMEREGDGAINVSILAVGDWSSIFHKLAHDYCTTKL
jgi:hypothetical protein